MKQHQRQAVCYNCHRPLTQTDNFCPNCGQENVPKRLRLSVVLGDFFNNYFSFDSKLARSTVPFLFKPGLLTLRFNEGKRASYVHPLRLYLIVTFVFFFLLALQINKLLAEEKITFIGSSSSSFFKIDEGDLPAAGEQLQISLDSVKANIAESELEQVEIPDTTAIRERVESSSKILDMMRDPQHTDDEIMDAMDWKRDDAFKRMLVHQSRKIMQKDMEVFLPYIAKNFSLMMFLLMPVFAFYVYLLFRRSEPYYLSHAIHALHLHSFSFLVLCISLILMLLFDSLGNDTKLIFLITFLVVTIYAFFSVKRVYRQSWLRTFFKFNLLGFFYFTTLLISTFLEVAISFYLF